jgi:hypothetical protein
MPIDVRRAQPADRRPWVWGIGLPLAVLVLLTTAVATDWQPLLDLDQAMADRAYELTAGHPVWLDALRVLADVSTPVVLRFLALLIAAALLVRGHRRVAIWLTFVTALQLVTASASKPLFGRDRPLWEEALDMAPGFSFPSGHAAGGGWFAATGVLLALMALPRGRLRRLVCAGVVLLGWSSGRTACSSGCTSRATWWPAGRWACWSTMIGWALLLRVEPPEPGPVVGTATVRPMSLAVVLNPVKVTNLRRLPGPGDRVGAGARLEEPLWFETTIDDPARDRPRPRWPPAPRW